MIVRIMFGSRRWGYFAGISPSFAALRNAADGRFFGDLIPVFEREIQKLR